MFHSFFFCAWMVTNFWGGPLAPSDPNENLLQAAQSKDLTGIRQALAAGADPQARNPRGETALHLATQAEAAGVMALLLDAGADANAKTQQGLQATPLMWATGSEDLQLGKLLLKNGALVNATDKYADHALNWAVYQGNLPYTELLLRNGADPRHSSRHGAALDIAMRRGFEAIMTVVADAIGLPPASEAGQTLRRAVSENDLSSAKSLFEIGHAETVDRFGRPLLQLATLQGDMAMVDWLLKAGAQVDQTDRIGFTPLMVAARDGHRDLCETLLRAGADINRQSGANSRRLTALTLAIIGDHEALATQLLRKGAKIDLGDANGNTPLILAVAWGRPHLVKMLLARGARTDLQNDEGQTALNLAERYQLAEITQLLRGS